MTRRWRAARLALIGLFFTTLVAACGGGAAEEKAAVEEDVAVGDESLLLPGSTTTEPAAATAAAPAQAPATTAAPSKKPAATTTTAARAAASGSGFTPQPDATVPPFPALALQGYTDTITFAVGAEPQLKPSAEALEHARSTFASVSRKPVQVAATKSLPATGSNKQWTGDELRALADKHLAQNTGSGTAVLRVLYVHGGLGDNPSVLGVQIADFVVMFPDRIRAAATGLLPPERIELSVVIHEAGHAFGLVDSYLKTGRADAAHGAHSSNKKSVMYYAVESTGISTVFEGGPPTTFDDADLADLAAIRDGAKAGSKG